MKFSLAEGKTCIENCNICKEGKLEAKIKCPANIPPGCGFCSTISSFGYPKSREKKHIISEINQLIKIGAKRIVLGASDFLDYYR